MRLLLPRCTFNVMGGTAPLSRYDLQVLGGCPWHFRYEIDEQLRAGRVAMAATVRASEIAETHLIITRTIVSGLRSDRTSIGSTVLTNR